MIDENKTYNEEPFEGLRDYYNYLKEEDLKINHHNNRILKAIESTIGKGFKNSICEIIEESGCIGYFKLSSDPIGEYQQENYYGCITGIWVQQTCSYLGDNYSGCISIKLKEDKYLVVYFEL